MVTAGTAGERGTAEQSLCSRGYLSDSRKRRCVSSSRWLRRANLSSIITPSPSSALRYVWIETELQNRQKTLKRWSHTDMDIPSASPGCPTPYRTKPRVPAKIFLIRRDELNSRRGGDVQEIRGALNKSRPDIINLEPARGAVRPPLASSDPIPLLSRRGALRSTGSLTYYPPPRALG